MDSRDARTRDDPRHWRPQRAVARGAIERIANPIAEPLWRGLRVIVLFRDSDTDEWGTVEVVDEHGEDALPEAMHAFDLLRRSIRATEAVIDGIVTDEASKHGVNIDFSSRPHGDPAAEPAFVAIDLLRVDDEPLLDVPLLERKRLLDGLVAQSPLVRISPWTGRPINPWFRTWRRAGFRGIVVKDANSRYQPGSVSEQWLATSSEPRI